MKAWAVVLSFFFSSFAFAGGDVVNNAGGASEQVLVYSFLNYEAWLEPCLRSNSCDLSINERALLEKIVDQMPAERANDLKFLDSKVLGGNVFQTEPKVGAVVQINKDLLWITELDGEKAALKIGDALSLLTLAFASHHPEFSDEPLKKSLASKVGQFGGNKVSTYLVNFTSPTLRMIKIKDSRSDLLLLEDSQEVFVDLNPLIKEQISCPVEKFFVYSFQWSDLILPGSNPIQTLASGSVGWICQGSSAKYRGFLTIRLKTMPVEGTVEEYWKNLGGDLKIIEPKPELILGNIQSANLAS